MLKKRISWIIAIYVIFIVLVALITPRTIDWSDNFSAKSTKPFGSKVLFSELHQLFSDYEIADHSFYTINHQSRDGNYILVTDALHLSEEEIDSLLKWVELGNNVFLSALDFPPKLLDTLNLASGNAFFQFGEFLENKSQVYIQSDDANQKSYIFDREFDGHYLYNRYDSLIQSTSLSWLQNESDTFDLLMEHQFGYGFIYLHTLPRAFGNYYMLKDNNAAYSSKLLSFLPDQFTYWDEYYKPKSNQYESQFKVFTSQAPFKWALYLGLALIAMYIVFKLKRNQRIIPILKPPENRTLEFTKTIGDLYFSTNDGRDLSTKMEKHFKEYIKEKFFIYNFTGSTKDVEKLSNKSGKNIQLIESINQFFLLLKQKEPTNSELIQLHQKLHTFYYGGK